MSDPATALDAMRAALEQTALSGDAYEDAQRLEQALHRARFAVLPVSHTFEVGRSTVHPGRSIVIIDDLPPALGRNALDVLFQAVDARPKRATAGDSDD